jgi:hypothetical protein
LEGLRSVVAGAAMVLSVGSIYDWAFCTRLEMLNMAFFALDRPNLRWAVRLRVCLYASLRETSGNALGSGGL